MEKGVGTLASVLSKGTEIRRVGPSGNYFGSPNRKLSISDQKDIFTENSFLRQFQKNYKKTFSCVFDKPLSTYGHPRGWKQLLKLSPLGRLYDTGRLEYCYELRERAHASIWFKIARTPRCQKARRGRLGDIKNLLKRSL